MTDKKTMTVQEAFDSLTKYCESLERTIDTLCDQIEVLEARIKKLEGNIKKSPVSESSKNNHLPLFKCLNCGKMVTDLSSHKGMMGYACLGQTTGKGVLWQERKY